LKCESTYMSTRVAYQAQEALLLVPTTQVASRLYDLRAHVLF